MDIELKTGKIKQVNLEQVTLMTRTDSSPQDSVRVHDKRRSRLPGQRLTTRYFVEFNDGRTQWTHSSFLIICYRRIMRRYKNFWLSFNFADTTVIKLDRDLQSKSYLALSFLDP